MPSRRSVIAGIGAVSLVSGLCGCVTAQQTARSADPAFARTVVNQQFREPPGTVIVDPGNHFLYLVQNNGQAIRYGVGVGGEGFGWSGTATIHSKQEWPDWYPPPEMLERKPEIREHMVQLPSGLGMHGGPDNPLGSRALYLWQGNKDTLYRIHGTNEPWTIGQDVSSGCIRMTNDDVVDLYSRAPVGAKVVVLRTGAPTSSASPSATGSVWRQPRPQLAVR